MKKFNYWIVAFITILVISGLYIVNDVHDETVAKHKSLIDETVAKYESLFDETIAKYESLIKESFQLGFDEGKTYSLTHLYNNLKRDGMFNFNMENETFYIVTVEYCNEFYAAKS